MNDRPTTGITWNSPLPSQRALTDSQNRDRARAKFKDDAKKASAEYEVERAAIQQKTERLKALRLARDAAAAEAAANAPAPAGKTAAKSRRKKA